MPALLAQGPCAFGSSSGFDDLLFDQITLGGEGDELLPGSRGRSLVASLSRHSLAFSHSKDLQPDLGQLLLEHLCRSAGLNFKLVQPRKLRARDATSFAARTAGSLDQVIEIGINEALSTMPHDRVTGWEASGRSVKLASSHPAGWTVASNPVAELRGTSPASQTSRGRSPLAQLRLPRPLSAKVRPADHLRGMPRRPPVRRPRV